MRLVAALASRVEAQVTVSPAAITLAAPEASQQLLVTEKAGDKSSDLTRTSKYALENPAIARVDDQGLVQPLAEGNHHAHDHRRRDRA